MRTTPRQHGERGLTPVLTYVIRQSNQLLVRRVVIDKASRLKEVDPPPEVPPDGVVVIQPCGSLFFAAAAAASTTRT
jgi:hypothetical protein